MHEALSAAAALFKIHVLRKKIPLFVSWNITFRCNLRCKYCAACDVDREELGTNEVRAGLDALWDLGTRWITFGGGEPLLRADIGELLGYARNKGFQVFISTNGVLAPKKMPELSLVHHVNLSVDGEREVHDEARGEGAFDRAMEAIDVCKGLKVPVSLQCVISKYNVDAVEEAIEIARRHGVFVMFQPATRWLSSSLKLNPISPEPEPYRKAIARLMELKKAGAPIRNSLTGLRHLAHWPDPASIWCVAGIVICVVEADGSMLACHQCQVGQFLNGSAPRGAVRQSFYTLDRPAHCVQCWCAPLVELGMLFSLHPEAIWNAVRIQLR